MRRVDVIVPCYKYARFLRACVESVLAQRDVEVRVLIIDDASPDDTFHVAAQLQRLDPRVDYRRHRVNRGHIETANEGIDWTQAEYSTLVSADDLLAPGALGRAVSLMDAHPEVGMTYGRQIVFYGEQPPIVAPAAADVYEWAIIRGSEFLEISAVSVKNLVANPSAVVRTELQKKIGGYRGELPHTGDMELWMRFAAHGSIGLVNAIQALKRLHGNNMQQIYLATALGDIRQRQAAFAVLFRDWGQKIQERARLEQKVVRGLAEEAFWKGSHAFDRGDGRECQEFLDYALELWPELGARREWRRLRWKRRLGARIWAWLRPCVNWVRSGGEKAPPSATDAPESLGWLGADRWHRQILPTS